MTKPLAITITSLACALVFAISFNPSAERHRFRIKESVADRNQLAGLLGLGALTAAVSTYHSLGVGSYMVIQDKTVSVGAFGLVYVIQ
ncbi:hypothetical protein [Chitinivorax sp. B]|uniref:hypothetical protein n=1 Tax=Chitinivorax sp. B TaxID=2502235 RepID=UPI0010FA2537|nr:hypothetical protein [Chitinivorax sp. B]